MDSLEKFSQLRSDIAEFTKPTLEITVTDNATSSEAFLVAKRVKALQTALESKRKEVVAPLNEQVKKINDYVKSLKAPLDTSEAHLKSQLVKWEMHLETQRREAARLLEEERKKRESEALAKIKDLDAQDMFGVSNVDTAKDELFESLAQDREDDKMAMQNIKETKVSGTRKQWTFEITDPNLVPKEYMTVDPKLIRAAVTLGKRNIPGVRIFEETKIAIRGG